MTFYIDVIFVENIILNYAIILSTVIICKLKINYFRILCSSFIGSAFSVISYFIKMPVIINCLIKVLISILMIIIISPNVKIIKFLKELLFFYIVSLIFGGLAFMLLFLVEPKNIVFQDNHLIGMYPFKIVIVSGTLGLLITQILSNVINYKKNIKEMLYDLEIFYNGKSIQTKAMVDSGNLLKEPISKADVIIVEKDALKGILSDEFLKNINFTIDEKLLKIDNIHSYKIKIIPFSSLGNENGILIGFKPDYVKVYSEKEIIRKDVLIAIYDKKLSKENLFTSLIGLNIINL